ncbi:hypothetical protein G6F59_016250 [Rhizopus arrhizus]|nr:hypothetical protein G6F59_016250 [Rhizopus arrhizus]
MARRGAGRTRQCRQFLPVGGLDAAGAPVGADRTEDGCDDRGGGHAPALRDLRVDEGHDVRGVGVLQRHRAQEAEQHGHGLAGAGGARDEDAQDEGRGQHRQGQHFERMDGGHDAQQVPRRHGDRIHRIGQELHDAGHGIVLRGKEAAEDCGHQCGGGQGLGLHPEP